MRQHTTLSADALHRVIMDTVAYGGATLSLTRQAVPSTGYIVGGQADEPVAVPLDADTSDRIDEFVNRNPLLSVPGFYLGTWFADGMIQLDVCKVYNGLDNAMADAAQHAQRGAFDLATGRVVPVPVHA